MPKELFRIKATERRDNMQDVEGLLNKSKVWSAKKTMKTTAEIYIPKAWEFQDDKLKNQLFKDMTKELARFVQKRLIIVKK
jgi:hypothetical protein